MKKKPDKTRTAAIILYSAAALYCAFWSGFMIACRIETNMSEVDMEGF